MLAPSTEPARSLYDMAHLEVRMDPHGHVSRYMGACRGTICARARLAYRWLFPGCPARRWLVLAGERLYRSPSRSHDHGRAQFQPVLLRAEGGDM